jgi:hypothetical protein
MELPPGTENQVLYSSTNNMKIYINTLQKYTKKYDTAISANFQSKQCGTQRHVTAVLIEDEYYAGLSK